MEWGIVEFTYDPFRVYQDFKEYNVYSIPYTFNDRDDPGVRAAVSIINRGVFLENFIENKYFILSSDTEGLKFNITERGKFIFKLLEA